MTSHRFHTRCGKNISLSDNNTIAGRVDGYDNGIVFTEQPVALGTLFQVKILEYDGGPWARFWNGTIVSG